jgi:hypothetical protein
MSRIVKLGEQADENNPISGKTPDKKPAGKRMGRKTKSREGADG